MFFAGFSYASRYCPTCRALPSDIAVKCATCGDGGFVYPVNQDGRIDYSITIPCPRCNAQWLAVSSRLPAASRQYQRLATWQERKDTTEGFQAAKDFVAGTIHPPLLLIYGNPGTGKSHLAKAIGWHFVDAGHAVLYFQVESLMDALRRDMGDDNHESRLADRVMRIPLLILDDLGAHQKTEWATVQLDRIINHRWESNMATVATANDPELQPRVLDRFRDGRLARMRGESFRGQK